MANLTNAFKKVVNAPAPSPLLASLRLQATQGRARGDRGGHGRSIGLFGGSFNPIHNGHIALARQLKELAGVDEVWLMVSPQNPLKQGSTELLDDRLRYEIACIALQGEEGLVACDYELHLPKPSYTWHTLQQLHQDYPQHTFVLLIGADNWQLFPRWYHAADILAAHDVVVYPRRNSPVDRSQLPSRVTLVDTPLLDISSTEIRQRVKARQAITDLVPSSIVNLVEEYYYKGTE